MMPRTISDDVQADLNAGAPDDVDDVDSAAEYFLKKWTKDPSDEAASDDAKDEKVAQPDPKETEDQDDAENSEHEDETKDETDHEDEDTSDDGDETDSSEDDEHEEPEGQKKLASDDHEVEITVDGETRRVPVKDLKRLFGQEASLTRKSQEVADQRKIAEAEATRHSTGLQKMLDRAKQRWEPFSKIDFLVAAKNMDGEAFEQLRAAAKSAYEDVQFYQEELNGHVQAQQQEDLKQRQAQAVECIKTLSDPDKGIKGWNQKMYEDLRGFAAEQGLAQEYYNRLLDPGAFKLIHMAYQFAQAQKVGVKKVANAPKNIQKTKNTKTSTDVSKVNQQKAMQKLRESGDVEDAAEVFLNRWSAGADRD